MKHLHLMILASVALGISKANCQTIPLYCWIVADNRGDSLHTYSSISNSVDELNAIYSQVAMEFGIGSISRTNSTYLTHVEYTNDTQIAELCSVTNETGGLELYFVDSITDGVNAFMVPSGIAVGASPTRTTLAHEVGHACGLSDIYDVHQETSLTVTGMPCRAWMPRDWGWYPEHVAQADVIKRLLMYGFGSAAKGDVSRGDIYGLSYDSVWNAASNRWDKVWHLGLAPVGFKDHGTRHPVSQ